DTSMPSDILLQFTPPFQQGIEMLKEPTMIVQNVGISANVKRRLSTSQSAMSVNTSRLPTTTQHHPQTVDVIVDHDMANRTTVPILIIFDRFRNMRNNNIQSNSNLFLPEIDFEALRWQRQGQKVFCAIKQSQLDYIRKHQNDLRSDYLSGLYDAVSRGDVEGITIGSKVMLPRPDHILAKVNISIGEASTSTAVNSIQIDEIRDYVDGRSICPFEASLRIDDFPIHSREPAVCEALGLLGNNKEWDITLEESAGSGSSAVLDPRSGLN
nr:DNA helicase [Tanacetum cinerariifolium]